MSSNISTLGWILIIGLVVFIVVLNLGLFIATKQKIEKDHWINKLTNAGQVLRNPLKKENDRYKELSDQVAKLKPLMNNNNENKQK